MKFFSHLPALLIVSCFVVQAQVGEQIRQAAISGSRGTSGKCTIEVRVDMTAEVDVYGDTGRLRTLAGQPATWTRFDCTDALPYQMTDFRFRGVDGRGSVNLVRDPRNNNSIAVIRIEDPKGGAEGYTFDIEWTGASGGSPTGGFPGGGYNAPSGRYGGQQQGGRGRFGSRMSSESAIDLCRTELRTRSERDYGLRDIDITAAAVDTNSGRRDWITGTFNQRGGGFRRGGAYRFNCAVDFANGQVRTLEVLRSDGSVLQPGSNSNTYSTPAYNQGNYDQNRVFRSCQDAVIARVNRDGYQNARFESTNIDTRTSESVTGSLTAVRGPVTDTFDYTCSMDFRAATVRNVSVNRR